MSWIAVAVGGASLIGGLMQGSAASSAANTQAAAANYAADIGRQEFNTITAQEQPYMTAGYGSLGQLNYLLGIGTPGSAGANADFNSLTGKYTPGISPTASSSTAGSYGSLLQPFTMDTWRSLSPQYGFQLQQGQQGVLNGEAAGSGALSGAAQKDLMDYNQNLANTSFSNAFNMYQTQQGNIYQRLAGLTQLGQAAAANTGQQGTALTGQIGQSITNAGSAQAAGQIGAANAYSGALNNMSYIPWLMKSTPQAPSTADTLGP